MSEIKQLRMNIMGGMNAYVLDLEDEDFLDYWRRNCFSDEPTEETLAKFAEDDDLWLDVVNTFAKIVRCD